MSFRVWEDSQPKWIKNVTTEHKKGENQVGPLQVITFHQPTTVDKEPEKEG